MGCVVKNCYFAIITDEKVSIKPKAKAPRRTAELQLDTAPWSLNIDVSTSRPRTAACLPRRVQSHAEGVA